MAKTLQQLSLLYTEREVCVLTVAMGRVDSDDGARVGAVQVLLALPVQSRSEAWMWWRRCRSAVH